MDLASTIVNNDKVVYNGGKGVNNMRETIKKKGLMILATTVLVLAASLVTSISTLAWAPDRETYYCDRLATKGPVFNSMLWEKDGAPWNCGGPNSAIADERQYVWMRECKATNPDDLAQDCKGSGSNPFNTESVKVEAGKTYEVSVYYHNNAPSSGNASGSSVMRDSTIKALIPSVIEAKSSVNIVAELSGSNMKVYSPDGTTVIGNRVQDNIVVSSDNTVYLRWIKDSMRIENKTIQPTKVEGGKTVVNPASVINRSAIIGVDTDGNELHGAGALFGSNALDGVVYGCTEFSGWIRFRVKAVAPGFSMKKDVAVSGSGDFKSDIVRGINVGDKVDFKISYTNTGSMNQSSITVKDVLRSGFKYVNGTAKFQRLSGSSTIAMPAPERISDDLISGGKDIVINGPFTPGAGVEVTFTAELVRPTDYKCGLNTLNNTATVVASGEKSDGAAVELNVVCTEPPKCPDGTVAPDGDLSKCPVAPKPKCTIKGKEQYDADDPRCKADELPHTGPMSIAFLAVSIAALGAGGVYWFKSRQALRTATAGAKSGGKVAVEKSAKKNAVQRTLDKVSKNVKKIVGKKK